MRNNRLILLIALFIASSLTSCTQARTPVPVGTIPEAKSPSVADEQYGHKAFGEITKQYELTYDHPRYNELQEVVKKITSTINADKDPWHIYLLKADNVRNAGATRGNHIFVWTGMLNYTQNSNELAAIMAHEIAHVLAGHTDADQHEKMRELLIGLGSFAIGAVAANATGIGNVGQIASQLGKKVGEGLFLNPYSQSKENEADQIGLFLMAKSKYDPQAAIDFWQRASTDSSFGGPGGSFFSTHPSSADRMQSLSKILPQAQAIYSGRAFRPSIEQPTSSTNINSTSPTEKTSTTNQNSVDSWDIRSQAQ